MRSLTVAEVRFRAASPEDAITGLLGFVTCEIEGLRVDGIALRRTRAGRLDLRYPERRRGAHPRPQAIVRPVDEATRLAIEAQIFAALRAQGIRP